MRSYISGLGRSVRHPPSILMTFWSSGLQLYKGLAAVPHISSLFGFDIC
jgi:hypothetical protein